MSEGAKDYSRRYSALFGKPVILVIVTRDGHIPIPCDFIAQSAGAIRIRLRSGWKMDLPRESILGVEEDSCAVVGLIN
jgi:hypothetical protein